MKFENQVKNEEIIVFANLSLYSRDSIFKCLYWYGDKFRTSISLIDEENIMISISSLSDFPLSMKEKEIILRKLERDLIDYNLRDIVTKETKNIRDLLIAKAFSNGEFDELPPGEISDPVGFDVTEIKNG